MISPSSTSTPLGIFQNDDFRAEKRSKNLTFLKNFATYLVISTKNCETSSAYQNSTIKTPFSGRFRRGVRKIFCPQNFSNFLKNSYRLLMYVKFMISYGAKAAQKISRNYFFFIYLSRFCGPCNATISQNFVANRPNRLVSQIHLIKSSLRFYFVQKRIAFSTLKKCIKYNLVGLYIYYNPLNTKVKMIVK